MSNFEEYAFQIIIFVFCITFFDPLIGRKISEWF